MDSNLKKKIGFGCLSVLIVVVLLSYKSGNDDKTAHTFRQVWVEDFNGKSINGNAWNKAERTEASWARHMTGNASLYEIKKGRLRLWCKRNKRIEPKDTATVLTAGLTTRNKKTIKFGKVEVRARMKTAQGCWCAIWMSPNGYSQPVAEIDIMEHVNHEDKVFHTVHTAFTSDSKNKKFRNQYTTPVDVSKYNTYAVEILPEAIIYYVNGKETMRYDKAASTRSKAEKDFQYPFGIESFLLISVHYGGTWVKSCNPKELPAYMDIDWIKMYELTD